MIEVPAFFRGADSSITYVTMIVYICISLLLPRSLGLALDAIRV